jgi:hypothetical protein
MQCFTFANDFSWELRAQFSILSCATNIARYLAEPRRSQPRRPRKERRAADSCLALNALLRMPLFAPFTPRDAAHKPIGTGRLRARHRFGSGIYAARVVTISEGAGSPPTVHPRRTASEFRNPYVSLTQQAWMGTNGNGASFSRQIGNSDERWLAAPVTGAPGSKVPRRKCCEANGGGSYAQHWKEQVPADHGSAACRRQSGGGTRHA